METLEAFHFFDFAAALADSFSVSEQVVLLLQLLRLCY